MTTCLRILHYVNWHVVIGLSGYCNPHDEGKARHGNELYYAGSVFIAGIFDWTSAATVSDTGCC